MFMSVSSFPTFIFLSHAALHAVFRHGCRPILRCKIFVRLPPVKLENFPGRLFPCLDLRQPVEYLCAYPRSQIAIDNASADVKEWPVRNVCDS